MNAPISSVPVSIACRVPDERSSLLIPVPRVISHKWSSSAQANDVGVMRSGVLEIIAPPSPL